MMINEKIVNGMSFKRIKYLS